MRIALIDDYSPDITRLQNYITDYFTDNYNKPFDIDTFSSGTNFIDNFTAHKYDVVFLDIYMKGIMGTDVAKHIYNLDENCKIIFVTTSNSFAVESYEVEALGYITKPVIYEQVCRLLNKIIVKNINDNKQIDLFTPKFSYHIFYNEIYYVECVSRTVIFHLKNNNIEINNSFHEITAPLLEDKRFVECYRGVIINMEHIKKTIGTTFILNNEQTVPISKRRKTEIYKKYMHFKIEGL